MWLDLVLLVSLAVNAYLTYKLRTLEPRIEVVEKLVEVEVGIPVCVACPEQHRLDGPNWQRRSFEVGSGEEGWARNWTTEEGKK